MIPLKELLPDELAVALAPLGVDAAAARRIFAHVVGRADDDLAAVPRTRRGLLARVAAEAALPRLEPLERRTSPIDGFTKYLFSLHDGARCEAVRIPLFDTHYTVCISSQTGCPLACSFCATGRMATHRNLAAWELVEQVQAIRREADRPVRGVVFMGMGEPLLNYDAVIRAARLLSQPSGPAIAAKAITISTAGVVPAIRRYTAEGHRYRLAISLHAGTHEKRLALMPIERRWPIGELLDAVRAYGAATRDRVTLEYTCIGGVNCGPDDAAELVACLRGLKVRLNLIDVNDATGALRPPSPEELSRFRDALQPLGAPIVRRYSGGRDVDAACGMLAARSAA